MSSSRKRAYKHKAYAEIDHLKQKLMMVEHHYKVMELMARKASGIADKYHAALLYADAALHDFEEFKDVSEKIKEALA